MIKRAMTSSSKRLQNDIENYESSSDKKIASNMYYIVYVRLENEREGPSLVKKLIKTKFDNDEMPLVAYTYSNDVYFLFSSLENSKEHFMNGSHHKICSYYASTIARERDMNVSCSIIELDSRTKILIYFQTKVYENARKTTIKLLKGKSDLEKMSFFELMDILKTKSINWDDLTANEKFGVFYKYLVSDSGKGKLSTLSELFDLRNKDKYTSYLFE